MRVWASAPQPDFAARVLSLVGLPPVLALPTACLAGLRAGASPNVVLGIAGLLVSGCVLPTLLTVVLARNGQISAIDLRERTDRLIPSFATAIGCLIAWTVLPRFGAPPAITNLALGVALQMALLALLTTRWKVSYHAASAGVLVVVSSPLSSVALTCALSTLAVCIAWARIHRRRHTLAQVIVGALTALTVAVLT